MMMNEQELFKQRTKEYSDLTEARLTALLDNYAIPARLSEAMRYSVMAGGKRLRPALLLATCELLGGDVPAALELACAIEMIHTYSLIHDDLPMMDNDDYRRGRLTNHKVFGDAMAILAGDALLSYAFEVMLEALLEHSSIDGYKYAVKAIADGAGARGMVAGQTLDLENEKNDGARSEQLQAIHLHKTGALLKAAVLAGAYVAGADNAQRGALERFAQEFGLLFQITDDILDVIGSSKELGKSVGKDADADKLTYPKLFGIDQSKQLAAECAARAEAQLTIFGEKSQYFQGLLHYTLVRNA
jgi:geranylgeranyl diphosphate synthase type II